MAQAGLILYPFALQKSAVRTSFTKPATRPGKQISRRRTVQVFWLPLTTLNFKCPITDFRPNNSLFFAYIFPKVILLPADKSNAGGFNSACICHKVWEEKSMFSVSTANSLGNLAAEAQTGLNNATLISKTLQHFNGSSAMSDPSLEVISATTKNLVNAAMGKGLNLDTLA